MKITIMECGTQKVGEWLQLFLYVMSAIPIVRVKLSNKEYVMTSCRCIENFVAMVNDSENPKMKGNQLNRDYHHKLSLHKSITWSHLASYVKCYCGAV